jgi:hypothetical protein
VAVRAPTPARSRVLRSLQGPRALRESLRHVGRAGGRALALLCVLSESDAVRLVFTGLGKAQVQATVRMHHSLSPQPLSVRCERRRRHTALAERLATDRSHLQPIPLTADPTCSRSHLQPIPLAADPTCSRSHLQPIPLTADPTCSRSHLQPIDPTCSRSHLQPIPLAAHAGDLPDWATDAQGAWWATNRKPQPRCGHGCDCDGPAEPCTVERADDTNAHVDRADRSRRRDSRADVLRARRLRRAGVLDSRPHVAQHRYRDRYARPDDEAKHSSSDRRNARADYGTVAPAEHGFAGAACQPCAAPQLWWCSSTTGVADAQANDTPLISPHAWAVHGPVARADAGSYERRTV